jgi:F0F1-type ATP synthase assembly protein I
MAPQRWTFVDMAERPMAVSYGLIGAIVVFGGLGYLFDRLLNSSPWLLLSGLAAGMIIGFYSLVRFTRDR